MSDAGAVLVLWTLVREPWAEPTTERARAAVPAAWLQRMPNYRRWQDVQMGLAGKLLLRSGLDQLGVDEQLHDRMEWSDSGRPSLPIAGDFNLTHSDGLVACAFSTGGPIGLDVEPIARFPVDDLDQVLTDGERGELKSTADPATEWCRIWTFKEAVIKADGRGVAASGCERIDSHRDEAIDARRRASGTCGRSRVHPELCRPPRDRVTGPRCGVSRDCPRRPVGPPVRPRARCRGTLPTCPAHAGVVG